MNIPTRITSLGLAGCFCSIFLHAAVPSVIHAAKDTQRTQRHSLIVRPAAASASAPTEHEAIAKRGVQRLRRLSLVNPAIVEEEPKITRRNSLNQLIPLGTQLPASLARSRIVRSAPVSAPTSSSTRPSSGKVLPAATSTMQSYEHQAPQSIMASGSRSTRDLLAHRDATALVVQSLAVPTLDPIVRTPIPQTPVSFPPSFHTSTLAAATVTWNANSETELSGYKVYVGTARGSYGFAGPFDAQKSTSYTVSGLPAGQTYYFAVSAYDSSGNESPLSNEVTKTIPN